MAEVPREGESTGEYLDRVWRGHARTELARFAGELADSLIGAYTESTRSDRPVVALANSWHSWTNRTSSSSAALFLHGATIYPVSEDTVTVVTLPYSIYCALADEDVPHGRRITGLDLTFCGDAASGDTAEIYNVMRLLIENGHEPSDALTAARAVHLHAT